VGADALVVALRLEGPLKGLGVGREGERKRGDGSDLHLGHGVAVEGSADIVEGSCKLLAWHIW
jgi:hypothetical protein